MADFQLPELNIGLLTESPTNNFVNASAPTEAVTASSPIEELLKQYMMSQTGTAKQAVDKSILERPVNTARNNPLAGLELAGKSAMRQKMIQEEEEKTKLLSDINYSMNSEVDKILKDAAEKGEYSGAYEDAVMKIGQLQQKAKSYGLDHVSESMDMTNKSVLKMIEFKNNLLSKEDTTISNSIPKEIGLPYLQNMATSLLGEDEAKNIDFSKVSIARKYGNDKGKEYVTNETINLFDNLIKSKKADKMVKTAEDKERSNIFQIYLKNRNTTRTLLMNNLKKGGSIASAKKPEQMEAIRQGITKLAETGMPFETAYSDVVLNNSKWFGTPSVPKYSKEELFPDAGEIARLNSYQDTIKKQIGTDYMSLLNGSTVDNTASVNSSISAITSGKWKGYVKLVKSDVSSYPDGLKVVYNDKPFTFDKAAGKLRPIK